MLSLIIQTLITISIYEFTKFVIYKIKHKTIEKNGAKFTILRSDKEAEKIILEPPKPDPDLFFKEYETLIDLMNKNRDSDIELMLYNEFKTLYEIKEQKGNSNSFHGVELKLD